MSAKTTLDVIELGARTIVADKVRDSIYHELERDPRLHATIVHSFTKLAGQRFPEKRIEYPADWWQAFKARWFARWMLRRWPARMTVITWSPMVAYPLIALPDEPRWEWVEDRQHETAAPE